MRTTSEVRTALHSRRKDWQKTAVVVLHNPTFCLKKANNTMQLALGGSINSTSRVHVPSSETGQLASTAVEVMVRDMCSHPQRIPASYHLSACLAARSEVEKKPAFVSKICCVCLHNYIVD
ncbi:hypothetical protein AVEN_193561-1 [Araneus ventricosus]|uniref:Uncharacterized protein n=1 Tax=Araneus ventricosus TaxID=182803 RepID=A0A4Y2IZI2_ARAVE|nr:hypothetical protein AVEN_193561-1 [Araneus ventricosus]